MATFKAPAGGIVSAVNGQFYNGGEFIPDHGIYCGKGKNRVTHAQLADFAGRLMALRGWTVRYREDIGKFQLVHPSGNGMASAASLRSLEAYAR